MRLFIHLVVVILINCLVTKTIQAQSSTKKLLRKARKENNNLNFDASKFLYLDIVKQSPHHFDALFELGLLYEKSFLNRDSAFYYYGLAEKNMPEDTVAELYYYLGDSYLHFEEYDKAIETLTIFKGFVRKKSSDIYKEVNRKISQARYSQREHPSLFKGTVEPFSNKVNTHFNEYAQVLLLSDSTLFFTRRSPFNPGELYFDNQHYEDIFYTSWKGAQPTGGVSNIDSYPPFREIVKNTEIHESFIDANHNEDELLLYRENTIWSMKRNGNVWDMPRQLPEEVNIADVQRHACFSKDGKLLIFSSDKKGGEGGFDLFYSFRDDQGNWTPAIRIERNVNTEWDEDSPFISEDGKKLYFSSQGHEGYGGFDVFVSEITGDFEQGELKFSSPKNLGRPINSSSDDIFFNQKNKNTILLSSNRFGSQGGMDIYFFNPKDQAECDTVLMVDNREISPQEWLKQPEYILAGEETSLSIDQAFFDDEVFDLEWDIEGEKREGSPTSFTFDSEGMRFISVDFKIPNKEGLNKKYCLTAGVDVFSDETLAALNSDTALNAKKTDSSYSGTSDENTIAKSFELRPVYFGFDDASLSEKEEKNLLPTIELLLENAQHKIQVIGHTDSKGPSSYNDKLAKKRAESVKRYLIQNGVNEHQIVSVVSKGEKQPALPNTRADGSDAPENRKMNRRVEMKLVDSNKVAEI